MPTIMTTPINDCTFSVVPLKYSVSRTPVSPGGTASKMRSGSRNERNEATRILGVGDGTGLREAGKPTVVLMVGVNGVGKTTTIGKLATKAKADGKTALLAAGDTFRAAAVQQLEVWGSRVEAEVVKGKEGSDPGAVAFEPGKNLDWYVDRAGGYTQTGDNARPYVTQPNGEREGVKRRTILADRVPHPKPGSVVYVPAKVVREDRGTANAVLGTVAQVLGLLTTIIVVATR